MPYSNSGFEPEEGANVSWVSEVDGKNSPTSRGLDGDKSGIENKNDEKKKCKVQADSSDREKNIVVVGSGDFGRALAGRLAVAGYQVTIASRDVNKIKRTLIPPGVDVGSFDVIERGNIIFLCIPKDFHSSLPAAPFKNKIVVDVSNRSSEAKITDSSQAESLQKILSDAQIVKGLNVLSAYTLENGGMQGSKEVPLAGDSLSAKQAVSQVVTALGFTPQDKGGLRAALDIENIPLAFFTEWKVPFFIHLGLFCFFYLLSFLKFQVCWPLTWSSTFLWELWHHIPMDNVNKTLAIHALNSLALVYLPGVIAAWLQIWRGTKYSRFPDWLDSWLRMRKQLGVLMLAAAAIHACLSLAIMSPTYQTLVYGEPTEIWVQTMEKEGWGPGTPSQNKSTVKVFGEEKMKWRGEMFLITGVMGFFLVCILGLTSLPSVTASLTWKEFMFIQSGLGWVSLALLCAHDMFYGWPYMNSPSCYIPSGFQYALYVPFLTLLLKLPLVVPPLSSHLANIRAGYNRSLPWKKQSSKV